MTSDDLAESMIPVACNLACLVRDRDREGIAGFFAELAPGGLPEEVMALLVVQAAMIPVEEPVGSLLSWLTWDGTGFPAVGHADDLFGLKPCGTYAAFCRHKENGEDADAACVAAAREYWAERKRIQKAARQDREAAEAA